MSASPASGVSLKDVVPLTLRRGQPYSEGQNSLYQRLAILNFGATGPYALNGVLPVFITPLSSAEQTALAARFAFDLTSPENVGEDAVVDGGQADNSTWQTYFSIDPGRPYDFGDTAKADYLVGLPIGLYVGESLNIYKSLLGFQFDINNPENIESGKSIVVFGSGDDGDDTETREEFVETMSDEYEVAAFTTVTLLHWVGREFSNDYDVSRSQYVNTQNPAIAFDDKAPSWRRLITEQFKSTVHEQGHTLGLQHPGVYNGNLNGNVSEWALWTGDSWDNSSMSYVQQPAAYEFFGTTDAFPLLNLTPRTLDLLALDQIYGQQEDDKGNRFGTHRAFVGDTVYGFNTNITEEQSIVYANLASLYDYRIATTIADGEGVDTIDASGFKYGNTIDLYVMTGNETSSRLSSLNGTIGNLSLAVGTVIENAIGGDQSDKIFDNQYSNKLIGNAGNDWFSASGGIDRIIGGSGYDRVVVDGNEDDFIVNRQTKSKTVIRHKSESDFRIALKDVEKYIFGDPMASAMNAENRGGVMVAGSKSDRRSYALLGMTDEESSLNLFGGSDQFL